MENSSSMNTTDDLIDLPPGFRFHPTDEELITHYLSPKSLDSNFTTLAIGDVDLNKVEPWDLPWKAKIGEKEWYFFFVRDRKYPTGLRTNRATDAGYWKATGKDKDILLSKTLIGMKKTLVFYRGRAPRGEKTNWVMHEYRLEGENHKPKHPKTSKKEWVICRVFKKSSGGKKVHISGMTRERECNGDVILTSDLPPLKELSSETDNQRIIYKAEGSHMSHATCFSKDEEPQAEFLSQVPPKLNPMSQNLEILSGPDYSYMGQDQSILMRLLLENNGQSIISKENQQQNIAYVHELGLKSWEDQVNLDCLWNY